VVAVMPVAAQAATQHWYRSGAPAEAGVEVPVVMFGGEANLEQQLAVDINCRTVGGGTIENPVGGGAGIGRTNSFAFYECKQPVCEEKVMKELGVQGRERVATANLPSSASEPSFPGWNNALEESTVGGVASIREKIGEPFVTFKTPSPPGMMRETEICEVAPTKQVLESYLWEGELKPEIGVAKKGNLNGASAAKPSAVRFEGESTGKLHSAAESNFGWFSGALKYLGYNEQEVITVKP
jgi:hypothetical protein